MNPKLELPSPPALAPPTLREQVRAVRAGQRIFEDATFLAAQVAIDPDEASRWLPPGLRLDEPLATLFVAHYPKTLFGSTYNEAGLFLHVRRWFRKARHSPWMLVDDDVALILGRELLGYPKKIGVIDLDLTSDTLSADVRRRGQRIFSLKARIRGPEPAPPPMLDQRFYNLVGSLGLSLPRLVSFRAREELIEAFDLELELELFDAPRDPLKRLGFGAVKRAFLSRVHIGGGRFPTPARPVSPLFALSHADQRYQ